MGNWIIRIKRFLMYNNNNNSNDSSFVFHFSFMKYPPPVKIDAEYRLYNVDSLSLSRA